MFHVYYISKDGHKYVRPCPDEKSKDKFVQSLELDGVEATVFERDGEMQYQIIRGSFKAKDETLYTFVDSDELVKDHRMGWRAEVECYDAFGKKYTSVVDVMTVGSATIPELRKFANKIERPKLGNVLKAWNVNDNLPKL